MSEADIFTCYEQPKCIAPLAILADWPRRGLQAEAIHRIMASRHSVGGVYALDSRWR